LIPHPDWSIVSIVGVSFVDRRMLPGLVLGLLGLAFGVAGAVLASPVLALAAGGCALGAAGAAGAAFRHVQDVARQASNAVDAVTLRHLELFTSAGNRSVVDVETGLPDQRFFELALDGRIAAARRHLWPMTLVLIDLTIDATVTDEAVVSESMASFANLLRRTLRESDIACRLQGTRFGVLLDDTAEEGGVWTAERLQIGLARDPGRITRLSAGVASYPTHAMRADEILRAARAALAKACAAEPDHGLGPVEVANSELS
jgi:diguanylate cyclase (GGDEF)-like protein